MLAITSALISAAVLGMWFPATRWLGISSTAMLCFFYPWIGIPLVLAVGWAFYYFRIR